MQLIRREENYDPDDPDAYYQSGSTSISPVISPRRASSEANLEKGGSGLNHNGAYEKPGSHTQHARPSYSDPPAYSRDGI